MMHISPSMKSRSDYVSRCLNGTLNQLGDEAVRDGWDGRELLAGVAITLKQICQHVGMTAEQAIRMVFDVEAPENRKLSGIIAPNGRPLFSTDGMH